jgi:hypothetical protein
MCKSYPHGLAALDPGPGQPGLEQKQGLSKEIKKLKKLKK